MIQSGKTMKPFMKIIDEKAIDGIIDNALSLLKKTGVFVENSEAFDLLLHAGAETDSSKGKVYFKEELVMECLNSAPSRISLYDSEGVESMHLWEDNIHFNPGSTAINILDSETKEVRKAQTEDFIKFAVLTDNLPYLAAQSTAFICYDVPEPITDSYRLYLALKYCRKPVITGTFRTESFAVMKELLAAIRGSEEALREKPLAIFDACPSPPLKWSNLTAQSLIDCARLGIPSQMVSMPLAGAAAPVSLTGSLIQHTAECMAGVVIGQLAEKGSPIIWGGSPAVFDMKKGTTPMGAIETMMIDSAYAQIGKRFNLPVHAYMGLTDSKTIDAQSGLEAGMGAVMAAASGINVISGAGMMDFESLQSLEKLVVDHEAAGMVLRLVRGIEPDDADFVELFNEYESSGSFLSLNHTLTRFRKEFHFPGDVIDRSTGSEWKEKGSKSSWDRAEEQVKKILTKGKRYSPSNSVSGRLDEIMLREAKKYGLNKLPEQKK